MPETSDLRALVVEDNALEQKLIKSLLEQEGFAVVVAGDGEEALHRIDNDLALIVLDMILPKTDGFEFLRKLRETMPELVERVVVVTNLPLTDVRRAFPVPKAIRKPFIVEELTQWARQLRDARITSDE